MKKLISFNRIKGGDDEQEGRCPRRRRHRVHADRAEGAGPRGQAPLPLPPLLYLPDRCKNIKTTL